MSAQEDFAWGAPRWTAAMYPRKTGMDHLGLASVSQDRVLPQLSPGINVLTIHPRYWSVYAWLLTEFWERDLPRTGVAWGRFLKPRERIFVAAVLSCPRHGTEIQEVAGKLRIRKEVDDGVASFDPMAPYLKNSRGGYPIYAAAVAQLGFSALDRDLAQASCDAPSPMGRQTGFALREWIEPTTYYREYFEHPDVEVPAEVVAEYSERICLCRATDGPDYPYLQHAFLHVGADDEAERRRASLRLVCDIADQTADEPVSSWNFRQLVYYRQGLDGRRYIPANADLAATARRWRIYQHRELVAWAFNRWLRQICTWGLDRGGDRAPLPLAQALETVDSANFVSLASELEATSVSLTCDSPLADLLEWVVDQGAISDDLDAEWDIDAAVSEEHLLDVVWDLDRCDDVAVAAIFTTLVACAARLWPVGHQLRYGPDWHLVRAGGRRRLAVDRFVEDMRSHVRSGYSVGESARWFLEHYVIRQHHRTALAKLPDDTFRLRLDVERLHIVPEPVGMDFNDSRFRALSTCAAELGFIKPIGEPEHGLTKLGRKFLKTGDLPTLVDVEAE